MEEETSVDGNNSHPTTSQDVAGPTKSITETYPGTKTPIQPKKASRMITKLINAIQAVGGEKGVPLGRIRNYLIENDLISPGKADWRILKATSDAVKRGIVTMGTAPDLHWLFRLATRQKKPVTSKKRQGSRGRRSSRKPRKARRQRTRRSMSRRKRMSRTRRRKSRTRRRMSRTRKRISRTRRRMSRTRRRLSRTRRGKSRRRSSRWRRRRPSRRRFRLKTRRWAFR